jgi:hypothetical protein
VFGAEHFNIIKSLYPEALKMKAVESFETSGTTSSVTRSNIQDDLSVGTAESHFIQTTFNTVASFFTNQRLAMLRPTLPKQRLALLRPTLPKQRLALLRPTLPDQRLALLRPTLPDQRLALLCPPYLIRILPARLQFSPPAARLG